MRACQSCGHECDDQAERCEKCGAPVDERFPFVNELLELLDRGSKIEAIKLYRDKTGAGLAEAKTAVEALQAGRPLPGAAELSEQDQSKILNTLRDGSKIEAIKIYRNATGTGLKDAKLAVEQLAQRNQIPLKGGCAGMLLLMTLGVCLLVAIGMRLLIDAA